MVIKICIVGSHQSGSTRLYNLVRLLYEKSNKKVLSMWKYENNEKDENEYDVIVCKAHNCNMNYLKIYNKVLLPVRNILDSAISAKKRFPNSDMKTICHLNIDLYNKFKERSDMIFVYEKYSLNYIKELCKRLGLELDDIELIKIMKELEEMLNSKNIVKKDNFADEIYKKTLLSQSHNTSGGLSNKYVKELSIEEIIDLLNDAKIGGFMKEYEF